MRALNKPYKFIAGFLIPIALLFSLVACINTPLIKYEETRSMMDTFVTVTVYSSNEETAQVAAVVDAVRETALEKVKSIR